MNRVHVNARSKVRKMSLSEKENLFQKADDHHVPAQVWDRIASYCAYQDRCTSEVVSKLEEFELTDCQLDALLGRLREQGYLDEKRFAESFVRGRFSIKKWGKVRIRQELKLRGIPEEVIKSALKLIDDEEYERVLLLLTERKWNSTNDSNSFKRRLKVQRFLIFRGFENDLIKEALQKVTQQPEA